MLRIATTLTIAIVSALLSPANATAPAVCPRVVVAVDGVQQTRNLPAILAERLGYFRDAGLIVTLVDAPAEPSPAQLLADGRADAAMAYFHHPFMAHLKGEPALETVALLGLSPGLKVMVAERLRGTVRSIADLKGRRIFTGGPNSGKTTTANWMMLHAGLKTGDYQPLPLQSREAMAAALNDAAADAIVAHEPDAGFYAARHAAFELAEAETPQGTRALLGSVYPSTALYLPKTFVAAHAVLVQRLVNAVLRAQRFITSHDSAALADALPAAMVGHDRAAFVAQLAIDKQMFAGDGTTDGAAARGELAAMAALDPRYATVAPGETFTNRFVAANARMPAGRGCR